MSNRPVTLLSRAVLRGLFAVSLTACGCGSPFMAATAKFGDAAQESTTAMAGMNELAGALCQRRARFAYDFDRIKGAPSTAGALPWQSYYKSSLTNVVQSNGQPQQQSWEAHCKQLAVGDDLVDSALQALGDYGAALSVVASRSYDGKDESTLLTDVSKSAQQLAGGTSSKLTDTLQSLATPVGAIAGALARRYAAKEAAKIVNDSAASVTAILTILVAHQKGIDDELRDAEELRNNLADLADAAATPQLLTDVASKPEPGAKREPSTTRSALEVVQMDYVFGQWARYLAKAKKKQSKIADALTNLQTANTALATVAAQKDPAKDDVNLNSVLSAAVDIASDVAQVVAAVRGEGAG
jgi:hypothetical protein